MSWSLMCRRVCKTCAFGHARFETSMATRPTAETAKVVSLFLLVTPNGSALARMIPAMEHHVLSALAIAVVIGVTSPLWLYGLMQVFLLIFGGGD